MMLFTGVHNSGIGVSDMDKALFDLEPLLEGNAVENTK